MIIKTLLQISGIAVVKDKQGHEIEVYMNDYEIAVSVMGVKVMERVSKELTLLGFPHKVNEDKVDFFGPSEISDLTPRELSERLNKIEEEVLKDFIKLGANTGQSGCEEIVELLDVQVIFCGKMSDGSKLLLNQKVFEEIDMVIPKDFNIQ